MKRNETKAFGRCGPTIGFLWVYQQRVFVVVVDGVECNVGIEQAYFYEIVDILFLQGECLHTRDSTSSILRESNLHPTLEE